MNGESLASGILSALVDKYEDSEAFRTGEPSQRRIQVRMKDGLVSGYLSGELDPDARRDLHTALALLAERGFVELKWVKFEEGNILDRVYLIWDELADIYAYLGRTPRRDELAELIAEMERWLQMQLDDNQVADRAPPDELLQCQPASFVDASSVVLSTEWQWIRTWVEDIITAVRTRGRIPTSLVPEDAGTRHLLLRALAGLIKRRDKALSSRLFSKQVLGNSKLFEQQIRSHVVRLVRRYWPVGHPLDIEAPDDDSTLLRELSIETGHEDITFCGPIRFRYEGEEGDIDAGVFPHGLAIDAGDVHQIRITLLPVSRILTVENKANYRAYVRNERKPDELVVYLGGFASPAQREFLRLLRKFVGTARHRETVGVAGAAGVPLHHWGDLDYGGILILQNLRNTCWAEATAWCMEPDLLDKYTDYVEPVYESYLAKLKRLLESDVYEWAHPLVRRMLDVGGILEQEALLV